MLSQATTGLLLEANVRLLLLQVSRALLLQTVTRVLGRDGMGRDGMVLGRDGRVLVHTPRLLQPSAGMLVLDAGRGLALHTSSRPLLHVAQGSCDPPPPPH